VTTLDLKEALAKEHLPALIHCVSGRDVLVQSEEHMLLSPASSIAVLLPNGRITTIATYNIEAVTPMGRKGRKAKAS
jgi:hypothetical protein